MITKRLQKKNNNNIIFRLIQEDLKVLFFRNSRQNINIYEYNSCLNRCIKLWPLTITKQNTKKVVLKL